MGQKRNLRHVRFGSLADIPRSPRYVRSYPESGHVIAVVERPLSAKSEHACSRGPPRGLPETSVEIARILTVLRHFRDLLGHNFGRYCPELLDRGAD
jgi:hypothetical protein